MPVTEPGPSGQRTTGADEARAPVAVPQATDQNPVPFVDGVHELAIANIDADVAQATSVSVGKDEHVTGLEIIGRNARSTGQLAGLIVRQSHAKLAVDPHNKAGAVEAGGRRATPPVGASDVLLGQISYLRPGIWRGGGDART